jgi:phosphoribosyl-AMP cyclohydrolase
VEDIETRAAFSPNFNADGLITAVVQDALSRAVLMVAHMNAEALARTIETGDAWYWSRSRGELWRKGATSGHVQRVTDLYIDCDQDAVLLLVEQKGPACHTGKPSCFYRRIEGGGLILPEE